MTQFCTNIIGKESDRDKETMTTNKNVKIFIMLGLYNFIYKTNNLFTFMTFLKD